MTASSLPKPTRPRPLWGPYFVLLIALLLTALAAYYVVRSAETKDRLRFGSAVERTQTEIERRLDMHIALLRAGSGLFAASAEVTQAEFRSFADRLELRERFPGIRGIGYSVRVPAGQQAALEAAMRRQWNADYTLHPATPRPEYHAIIFIEPQDQRNRAALGYDMFTDPVRRAAMERARDTGEPAASGRVTLVQEIEEPKQPGFLIYVPVYRKGSAPQTVAERQAALQGFVYSPFRAEDLFLGIFAESQPEVDFQVYDGAAQMPVNLLHDSRRTNATSSDHNPLYTATTATKIGGQPWTFVFTSRPAFDQASQRRFGPPS